MNRTSLVALALVSLVGCKKSIADTTATRQAWAESAGPCPANTTCTGKRKSLSTEHSVCAPALEKSAYAPNDVVLVDEIAGSTIGRIKAKHGEGWDVEFPDGYTLERAHAKIVARVCKP